MADKSSCFKKSSSFTSGFSQLEREPPKSKDKKRKKKKPKTHRPVTEIGSQSRKDNKVINTYHALKKKCEAIKIDSQLSPEEKTQKSNELTAKMEKLGGLDAYQKASKLGESRHGGFNAAKWVVKQLKDGEIRKNLDLQLHSDDKKIKLLDVGALDHNYRKQSWIDCTPIDLNPQNSSIMKMNFLKFETKILYHVIVLSLVINFEGDPHKRGDMLKKCSKLLYPNGYVVIVLPLPCVKNSRCFSVELLQGMMGSLGFALTRQHSSRRLYFSMFKRTGKMKAEAFQRKTIRKGDGHNNFSIVL